MSCRNNRFSEFQLFVSLLGISVTIEPQPGKAIEVKVAPSELAYNISGSETNLVIRRSRTLVGVETFVAIKKLGDIHELNLSFTNFSDKDAEYLRDMPSLKKLYLYNTEITEAGLKKLKGLLPNCSIDIHADGENLLDQRIQELIKGA